MTVADGELSGVIDAGLAGLGSFDISGDGTFSGVMAARLAVVVTVTGDGTFSGEMSATLAGIVLPLADGSFRGFGPTCSYTGWGGE